MRLPEYGRRRRGFNNIDVIVGLAILILLGTLTANAVLDYYRVRTEQHRRLAASWAAAGQLDRYRAGAPLDSKPPDGLWSNHVTLATRVQPATGQWEGFRQVTVVATARLAGGREIHEQVSGYLPQEGKP
ncbi:MAG TPA: type II secretion system protein [Phycisphaerae bacterium]|nr:type II secretion system protein [Phycisphaerae bacterium]HRY67389.1 type II secretion system protein [Phycisphaerae bacterium]HSA29319.1 type II secretion system protein [Phycisphaerae bacterium]